MGVEEQVARHYGGAGIAARVLAALREAQGPDAPVTVDGMAPFDQFHGRGVVATRALAALLAPQRGERLLDIGCGIGGPARWMAASFVCHVTGIDMTAEFCAAAEELNAASGMMERVTIIRGSALALPVPDGVFDAAYSQNVVMNIADKPRFYREAYHALRPGGRLALSNICAGPTGPPYFPLPWATTAETSFLATPDEMRAHLAAAGFIIAEFRDITETVRDGQRRIRDRLERGEALPPAGADIILGARAREMQRNNFRSSEEGRCTVIEALARKPG